MNLAIVRLGTGFMILLAMVGGRWSGEAKPLALHPENSHYFLYKNKPAVLITSAEHYGAVLNLDFNYVRYLTELESKGLNLTRTFTGAYVEPVGAFRIEKNTLAPAPTRLIAPWARSTVPGYANGGNKFDLTKWDPAYFKRLKDFLRQAEKRGVIVELVLFCPFYEDSQWSLSPQNAANNINGIGEVARTNVYTLDKNGGLLAVHEALTRKIVTELKGFDNLYYEICNEPYFGGVTMEWQHRIADVIVETEKKFRNKHLISMNIANGSAKIQDPHPAISIFNFHYANPPTAVGINYGLNKVIGDNETGFRGTNDLPYRLEAWNFILAGGGLFNHLDYSFAVGHEDGSFAYPSTQPGGGNAGFRRQMKILSDFIHGFDFLRLKPDLGVIKRGVPVGFVARALAESGKAYAIYLSPAPAAGMDEFSARWTGKVEPKSSETYTFHTISNDGVRLWVNGQLIIDNWTSHSDTENSGTIELEAGKRYDLKLEYFQDGGHATMKLFWSSPSQTKEIISGRNLILPDGRDWGLEGKYYFGKGLEHLRLTRNDGEIDFDWSGKSPFANAKTEAETQAALQVDLPPGNYHAAWIVPQTGETAREENFRHSGGTKVLHSPAFSEDMALRIIIQK